LAAPAIRPPDRPCPSRRRRRTPVILFVSAIPVTPLVELSAEPTITSAAVAGPSPAPSDADHTTSGECAQRFGGGRSSDLIRT
jgi:hypothetical protein